MIVLHFVVVVVECMADYAYKSQLKEEKPERKNFCRLCGVNLKIKFGNFRKLNTLQIHFHGKCI